MKVLVLNSGSSTQKMALFELDERSASADPVPPLWEGKLEWDGEQQSLNVRTAKGKESHQQSRKVDGAAAVKEVLRMLWQGPAAVLSGADEIDVIGHRIVHGGAKLAQPVVIDSDVKRTIAEVAEIAPLHNRAGLKGIEIAEKMFSGKPQIAVFDTGFHRTMPDYATVYPGPYEWVGRDIRRYGFHGINHEYCAYRAADLLKRHLSELKIISCHLGNGCSLAAIDGGRSIDTTMGFTPLDGIMMGTRGGEIDPGILVHLIREDHATAEQLDTILNRRSGLLGISGVSSDMRYILKATDTGNPRAKLAFEIFVHRLQTGIAAMAASLGGIDAIVFTAGIGENSAAVRGAACRNLAFLGVQLDAAKNNSARPDIDISTQDCAVRVLVIRAQEDWAIARECLRLTKSGKLISTAAQNS